MKKKLPYKKKLYILVAVILCLCYVLSITGMTWINGSTIQSNMTNKMAKLERTIERKMRVIEASNLQDPQLSTYEANLAMAEIAFGTTEDNFGFYYTCNENEKVVAQREDVVFLNFRQRIDDEDMDTVFVDIYKFAMPLSKVLNEKQTEELKRAYESVEESMIVADGYQKDGEFWPANISILCPKAELPEATKAVEHSKVLEWIAAENVYMESNMETQDYVCVWETEVEPNENMAGWQEVSKDFSKDLAVSSEFYYTEDNKLLSLAKEKLQSGTQQKKSSLIEVTRTGKQKIDTDTTVSYGFSGKPLTIAMQQLYLVYVITTVFYILIAVILYSVMHMLFSKQEEWDWSQKMLTRAIAHELKTPISIIQGYCEGLQYQEDKQRQKEYLDTITHETKEMNRLVLDMLELSKLETTGYQLEPEEIALGELIHAVMKQYDVAYHEKEIRFVLEGDTEACCTADLSCMYKVLSNLIGNAIKHAPEHGIIKVSIEHQKGKLFVGVYNNGPEIEEEIRAHIWDGYHKALKENKGKIRSTGLGLTIVKYMLDMHGFSYGCENRNPGVEFWFSI